MLAHPMFAFDLPLIFASPRPLSASDLLMVIPGERNDRTVSREG